MKSITVVLENGFLGHQLWIASNAYIQKVVSIKTEDKAKDDEVLIGKLNDLFLFGQRHPSGTLQKTHFVNEPAQLKNRMWVKVSGKFFAITGVHTSPSDAHKEMMQNERTAIIDEIHISANNYIYINAVNAPSKVNKH